MEKLLLVGLSVLMLSGCMSTDDQVRKAFDMCDSGNHMEVSVHLGAFSNTVTITCKLVKE